MIFFQNFSVLLVFIVEIVRQNGFRCRTAAKSGDIFWQSKRLMTLTPYFRQGDSFLTRFALESVVMGDLAGELSLEFASEREAFWIIQAFRRIRLFDSNIKHM